MAAEPLVASPAQPPILPLNSTCNYPLKVPLILPDGPSSDDAADAALTLPLPPRKIHRCKTAPAMPPLTPDLNSPTTQSQNPQSTSTLAQAAILLLLYLSVGVLIYSLNRDSFSGVETHPLVDALYFCIVTMCTIGYGDIAPLTAATKVFACLFVLVGFGFIDILLSSIVFCLFCSNKSINQFQIHYCWGV